VNDRKAISLYHNHETKIFAKCVKCKQYAEIICKMSKNNDNRQIISRIKSFYGFTTDTQLAEYLGISTSTLNGWVNKRGIGDWELIFDKCADIDLNWLIKGHYATMDSQNASMVAESKVDYGSKFCQRCVEKERLITKLELENERLWGMVTGNKNASKASSG